MMKTLSYTLLLAGLSAAGAADADWQTAGPAQYLCGGVGDESMSLLQAQRGSANLVLLFAAGQRDAYIADVDINISGRALTEPLHFMANGPTCLVKLPQGQYRIDASWQSTVHTQTIKTTGKSRQIVFKWQAAATPQ